MCVQPAWAGVPVTREDDHLLMKGSIMTSASAVLDSPAPEASTPVRRVKTFLKVRQSRPPFTGDILTVEEEELSETSAAPAGRSVQIRVTDGRPVVLNGRPYDRGSVETIFVAPEHEAELNQRVAERRLAIIKPVEVQFLKDCSVHGHVYVRGEVAEINAERAVEMSSDFDKRGCRTRRTAIVLAGRPPFPKDQLPPDPTMRADESYQPTRVKSLSPLHCRAQAWLKPPDSETRDVIPPGTDFWTHIFAWAETERSAGRIVIVDPIAQ